VLAVGQTLAAGHAAAHVATRHYNAVAFHTHAYCALLVLSVCCCSFDNFALLWFLRFQAKDAFDFEGHAVDNYYLFYALNPVGHLFVVQSKREVADVGHLVAEVGVVDRHHHRKIATVRFVEHLSLEGFNFKLEHAIQDFLVQAFGELENANEVFLVGGVKHSGNIVFVFSFCDAQRYSEVALHFGVHRH